jgi:hypothetical protein
MNYVSPINGTTVQKEYWRIGNTSNLRNVTTNPKGTQQVYMFKIIDLTPHTFAAGDYLQIQIIPSANSNTNWEWLGKCFTAIDCDIWGNEVRTILPNTVQMVWNPTDCTYDVSYTRQATWGNTSSSIFYRYHLIEFYGVAYANTYTVGYPTPVLTMRFRIDGSAAGTTNIGGCAPLLGTTTYNKSGSIISVAYSHQSDYDNAKASWNFVVSLANMGGNYTSDPTKFNHYKFMMYNHVIANSCGDTKEILQHYFHYSNTVVFNDTEKTFTINIQPLTNQYVNSGSPCDKSGSAINSYITQINNAIARANRVNVVSNVRSDPHVFYGVYVTATTVQDTNRVFSGFHTVTDQEVCDLAAKGWTAENMPAEEHMFRYMNERVVITNASDPINNFRLERLMTNQGVILPVGSPIKIYEIINGVVTPLN